MSQVPVEAIEHLLVEIRSKADGISTDAKWYRRTFLRYIVFTASLSAATTFLIAAGEIAKDSSFSVGALAASAVSTVVAAWGANFKHRDMWVQKNGVLSRLRELISRLEYAKAKGVAQISQELLDDLYEQYQGVMREASEGWRRIRDHKEDDNKTV